MLTLPVTSLLEGCTSLRTVQAVRDGGMLRIPLSEFASFSAMIVEDAGLPAPVFVSHFEGNYSAVLMQCTHKRCTVQPVGRALVCPCHGSEYELNGIVVKKPAERNLIAFPVSIERNHLVIRAGES